MYSLTYIHAYIYAYDDTERAILTSTLQLSGIHVYIESTIEAIIERWTLQPAELLVVALPTDILIETVVTIRRTAGVPLIMLLDPINEDTQIACYEAGADLVLLRPYSPRLLLAQARNLAHRSGSVPFTQIPKIQFGALQIDPATRKVTIGESLSSSLTQREFQLFYLFYTHAGQTLTTEQIIDIIWGYTGVGDKSLVRSLINRLRSKIEPCPDDPTYIKNVSGIGYRFESVAKK